MNQNFLYYVNQLQDNLIGYPVVGKGRQITCEITTRGIVDCTDILGSQVCVGDIVVFSISVYITAYVRIGKILDFKNTGSAIRLSIVYIDHAMTNNSFDELLNKTSIIADNYRLVVVG